MSPEPGCARLSSLTSLRRPPDALGCTRQWLAVEHQKRLLPHRPRHAPDSIPCVAGLALAGVARLITGAQGHWYGAPPKAEQRIYFANHQSHFDWVLIWAALPRDLRTVTRPIAARDYWTSSKLKHWITREIFNAVYVSRQRTDDEDPLEPLMEALRHGDSLVIFPEGTRGNKVDPAPFKAGLFHLAEAFPEVQLIPAWIDNVQRVMPKGEVVPVPILCSVTFGKPLLLFPGEDKRSFLERARNAVMALRAVH